jgi:hypothetical protein
LRTHHAIVIELDAALKGFHRRRRPRTEGAIGPPRIEAAGEQFVLQIGYFGAATSLL